MGKTMINSEGPNQVSPRSGDDLSGTALFVIAH